ncbi:signal peptide peptidase SppA [Methanobacterium sp. CWC-01]|uniref:signal peptide peptidase SppA n=1 Tax=Methanobacterium aridiramus TaxID=2584467 RepID=UPI00257905A2|nr:signal peptide peptidase SppA [Methanobacterium sp. CWC-01]WJI08846.1 signal peptide peptidase SppA [Methanobacterium sp. CWC-01]
MKQNNKLVLGLIAAAVLVIMLLTLGAILLLGSSGSISLGDTVAVIPLEGEIAYGESNILEGQVANPESIENSLRQAEEDPTVSAILLEINSPGGSPVASEEVMSSVKNCTKPVVVWISDQGASGAYLVASAADKIVASPSSIVGSIGVILSLTDLSELYQKMGVNKYSIKAGEYKDMGADYRNLTSSEQKMLQEMVDQDYDYFIRLVALNRNLNESYVRSIAEGKIYTGSQAKNLKLVDETGGKKQALDLAARLGGISDSYRVVTITPSQDLEDVINSLSTNAAYALGKGIGSFMEKGAVEYNIS